MTEKEKTPEEKEKEEIVEETRKSLELNHFESQLYKNEKMYELKIKETFIEGIADPKIYEKLENKPKEFIETIEQWLEITYEKPRTIILTDFPKNPSFQTNINEIRSKDRDKLLFITGVVKSKSEITVITTRIDRECQDCEYKISHHYEIGQETKKYYYCPQCLRTNKSHRYMKNLTEHKKDLFYINLEEPPEDNTSGELARIPIIFEGRLADPDIAQKITRGTKVTIAGTLRLVTRVTKYGTNTEHYLIKAYGIEIISEEQQKIQMSQEVINEIQKIRENNPSMVEYWTKSIYKNIEGEQKIKESIIVQLVGNPMIIKGNKKTRGDIHILMIGEAGTVKTTFLKLTQAYALKSRYSNAGGSSAVGLIGGVLKDELIGGFQGEAGAMPLCNKGIICIAEDTLINTQNKGLIKIKEAQEGDHILTRKGWKKILKVHNNGIQEKIMRITPKTGLPLSLTPTHKILDAYNEKWIIAQESKEKKVCIRFDFPEQKDYYYPTIKSKHHTENTKKMSGKKANKNDYYLLGVTFFDGCISRPNTTKRGVSIAKTLEEEAQRIRQIFTYEGIKTTRYTNGKTKIIRIGSNIYADWFTKFREQPELLLNIGTENFKQFIAGIIDCDGWIGEHGSSRGLVLTPINKHNKRKICETIMLGLRGLGYPAYIDKNNAIKFSDSHSIQKFIQEFKNISHKVSKANIRIAKTNMDADSNILPKKYQEIIRNEAKGKSTQYVKDNWASRIYYAIHKTLTKNKFKEIITYLQSNEKINEQDEKQYLEEITKIEIIPYGKNVYDLTIEEEHEYFANGILVHNCIDEFDKLDEDDVKKMHEALENQIVSIDKANVHITLPCQTSVLGAGNPKYGMFDLYKNIYEQIEFPPAFLNRFDIIWVLIDKPDPEKDKRIAEKIIQNLAGTEETEDIKLFKQYLTLAKSIQVNTTKDIEKEIVSWYENIRKRSNMEGKSIRLNARSVETIIRLMLAHTRAELRNEITKDDFDFAKDLFLESIKLIATDLITGEIDTQIISTGISHSENQIIQIILQALTDAPQKELTYQDIRNCIDKKVSDITIDKLLAKMKKEGDIFESRNGIYNKI